MDNSEVITVLEIILVIFFSTLFSCYLLDAASIKLKLKYGVIILLDFLLPIVLLVVSTIYFTLIRYT